jgi:hypothetical protein
MLPVPEAVVSVALGARIESGRVTLMATFDLVTLALGRVFVKEGGTPVIGGKKIEGRHMTGPALGHGVRLRLVTDQAVRHQRIMLKPAQARLLQPPMTCAADLL